MKKNALLSSLAGAGLLIFSLAPTLAAQDHDPDAYHHDRDAYFHGGNWHMRMFERVREDLQHVQASTWPRGGDQYRIDKTMDELNDLQSKMANRVYDESELDRVIDQLGRVASYNEMAPRDRDILNDDVARLREYREHHADWVR
ncbi:MAG TPA: hypothetical protein VFW44_02295 [Bryobacteraceae bacterium]|nr:hypothetical protein [Bryobacteraceae bacterium]